MDVTELEEKVIKRQKILRELYLVEYIVQMLYFPFATKTYTLSQITQDDYITLLCQDAYQLLDAAVGGYEINERYASQWINFFFAQAMRTNKQNDISAQATVEELLSDNTQLLETRITPQIIKQFIQLCKSQEKDKKLIMLLTALCTCYGKAVEHNQMFIVKFLLEDRDTQSKLMMPIRIRQGQLEVKLQGNSYITLHMLEEFSMGRDDSRIYKYFKQIVNLAANLNIGRNQYAYQQLNNLYPFDPVFSIIYDQNLPFDIRSCFLMLMNSMHLDRDPLEPLDIPTTTMVMNNILAFEDFVPQENEISYNLKKSEVEIPSKLLKLKDFVLEFLLAENGVQDINNKKKNKFVQNMISTLYFLLQHGFYRGQEEINSLAKPLIMLLDGSDDIFEEEGKNYENEDKSAIRYKYTQKSEIMLVSKKVQCECLIFMSQMELDGRAELFLSRIKRHIEQQGGEPILQAEEEAASKMTFSEKVALRVTQKTIPQLNQDQIMSLDQIKGQSTNVLEAISSGVNNKPSGSGGGKDISNFIKMSLPEFLDLVANMKGFEGGTGEIYICILFDLLLYQYNELNQVAFDLLIKFFNRKTTLLEAIQNIQILESQKSIEIHTKVKEFQQQLKDLQQDAELFMTSQDGDSSAKKQSIAEIFTFLTRFLIIPATKTPKNGDLPKRRSSGMIAQEPEKLEDLLGKLKSEDYVKENLKPEDDHGIFANEDFCMFVPRTANENKENQRLMMNFSLFDFAVYFIKYRTEETVIQSPDHQAMIKQCYRFLIKFVKGNVQNQQKLREHLDIFMRDLERQPLAIQLVYEIFKNNKKFLNLNASKILKKISNASEKTDLGDSKKGLMYQLLTAFCRCKDKLVRANQQDIVVYLTSTGTISNIFYLFVGDGVNDMLKIISEQKKIQMPDEEKDLIELGVKDLIKGVTKPKPVNKKGEFDPSKVNPCIVVSNKIINITALIDLLSLCCEGKSDKAEEQCQKELMTLENCLKIVKACEYFWPFKRTMVNYVWQCFLDSNSKTIFVEPFQMNIDYIWEMAEILLQDIKNILLSIPKKMDSEVYVRYPFKAPVTLRNESIQFLTESILPFFKYMIKRKDIYIEEEKEYIIAEFTACTVDFYYITQDPEAKRSAYNILGYIYTRANLAKYLDSLKHPLIGLHPGNIQPDDGAGNEEGKEQFETFNYDKSDSSKISKVIGAISSSEEVKEMIEKEFEELVSWFVNIEDRVKDVVAGNSDYQLESFSQLTFPNIVKALLEMLDKRELSKPLHSIGLQIVRKLIEAENKNCLTPAAEWDTEDYIDFKGQIVEKQNQLVEIGVVQFLCKHIADLDDDQLLEQCVYLGISLLLGGNKNAQEAFLVYFQENDTYNKTLSKLKLTMIKEFEKAKLYLNEKNAKLSMIAKTQEKMALYHLKKQMKQAKENAKKDPNGKSQLIEEAKAPEEMPFAPEADEEEEAPEGFDNTLENLMTIEQSQAGDVSIITGQDAGGNGGEEGGKAPKEAAESKSANNENQKSLIRVVRILRLLQLMAEGHFRPLQDHLREQKMTDGSINPRSFDFIAFISTMLGVFQKQYLNCYSHELGSQMIDTLVEVIQGPCKDNQRSLVSAKAIDNCRDLLNAGSSERELKMKGFVGDKVSMVDELKQKAVKLLLSIIEGPIDAEIMRSIKKTMDDFAVVFERMKTVYTTFVTEMLNMDPEQAQLSDLQGALSIDSFDDDAITEGFDLYSLVKSMAETVPSVATILENYVNEPYMQFFQKNTGFIEIYHTEFQQILRVYFPIKPVCLYLSKQTRSILMREVDRSSPQQKIMDLLKAVPDIVDEMSHIELLSRATIKVTPALTDNIRLYGLINVFAICVLITIFYEYNIGQDTDGSSIIEPIVPPQIDLSITILGAIQILVQLLLIIGESITRGSLIVKSRWREYVDEKKSLYINLVNAKKEAPGYSEFNIVKAPELSLLDARLVLLTSGPDAEEFVEDAETGKKNFGHLILKIEYIWTSLTFIIADGRFFFLLVLLTFSVLGLLDSPAFFSFLLLDIVNRFPSLQNVIKAVTTNGDQLIMTGFLMLIILWIYNVILFTFLSDWYFNDDITWEEESGDHICRSMLSCYFSTLNFGLRNGGGIGDTLGSVSYFNESREVFFLRSFNDLSYMIIIVLLSFNIIFGIIIDTFGGLREEAAAMDDDMRNVCYICGIDRPTFDKDSANGYMHHIKQEHNLWQYVFFMIYLNSKDSTDYTGIESYVSDKLVEDDISWFPFNKAISLEADSYVIQEGNSGDNQ